MNPPEPHPLAPQIAYGVDVVSGDHNPDCPVIVPLGAIRENPSGESPFAAILALDRNDRIARQPRLCIHVSKDENGFFFSDGVFAVKSAYPTITSAIPFPQLCEGLRKDRREWSPLLNIRKGERPYLHVKNWHEGDKDFDLEDNQLGAAACLEILRLWNGWEEPDPRSGKSKNWKQRMFDIHDPKDFSGDNVDDLIKKATNKFQKLCNDLGLVSGQKIDNANAFSALSVCLDVAVRVRAVSLSDFSEPRNQTRDVG